MYKRDEMSSTIGVCVCVSHCVCRPYLRGSCGSALRVCRWRHSAEWEWRWKGYCCLLPWQHVWPRFHTAPPPALTGSSSAPPPHCRHTNTEHQPEQCMFKGTDVCKPPKNTHTAHSSFSFLMELYKIWARKSTETRWREYMRRWMSLCGRERERVSRPVPLIDPWGSLRRCWGHPDYWWTVGTTSSYQCSGGGQNTERSWINRQWVRGQSEFTWYQCLSNNVCDLKSFHQSCDHS